MSELCRWCTIITAEINLTYLARHVNRQCLSAFFWRSDWIFRDISAFCILQWSLLEHIIGSCSTLVTEIFYRLRVLAHFRFFQIAARLRTLFLMSNQNCWLRISSTFFLIEVWWWLLFCVPKFKVCPVIVLCLARADTFSFSTELIWLFISISKSLHVAYEWCHN